MRRGRLNRYSRTVEVHRGVGPIEWRLIHNTKTDTMPVKDDRLDEVAPEPVADDGTPHKSVRPHYTSPRSTFWRTVQQAQKYSSWTFSAFAVLHTTSTVVAPAFSVGFAHSAFKFGNAIYQADYVEPVLVFGSLGVHVLSGLALRAHRVYHNKKYHDQWRFNLNPVSASGWLLVPLVLSHAFVTRVAPQWVLGDSSLISLDYITHSLQRKGAITYISMSLLTAVASFHVVYGWAKWLRLYSRRFRWYKYSAVVVPTLLALVSMLNLGRQPSVDGWIASQFDKISAAFGM